MLLGAEQFVGFLVAAVLITASPGPDNLMVLGVGISKGRRQGIAFGLGCACGCLSHTLLAALGVSALIAASPVAFTALKICGGLYLLWLGFNALRSSGATKAGAVKTEEQSPTRLFFRGVLANAINPKVVLFFLSFLPQFVIAANGNMAWQIAALGVTFTAQAAVLFGLLGVTFTAQAAVLFGLLGYFSGAIGQWLKARPRAGVVLDRVAGGVFVALGLRLLVSR